MIILHDNRSEQNAHFVLDLLPYIVFTAHMKTRATNLILRGLRAARGLTQAQLARQVDDLGRITLGRITLTRIETGRRQATPQERVAIAEALGVDVGTLFPGRG